MSRLVVKSLAGVLALGMMSLACWAHAADDERGKKEASLPAFPKDAANWINARPVTAEMLAGKATVLYFFETG